MPHGRRGAILLGMIANAVHTPIPFVSDQLAALRVFVADDNALYREVVTRAIDRHPGLAVAGEAPDGETALAGILTTAPDVALLDLRMPGLDGLEVCERLRAAAPHIAVVILTAFDDDTTPASAASAGARACLGKDATEAEICQALLCAGDGAAPPVPEPI